MISYLPSSIVLPLTLCADVQMFLVKRNARGTVRQGDRASSSVNEMIADGPGLRSFAYANVNTDS